MRKIKIGGDSYLAAQGGEAWGLGSGIAHVDFGWVAQQTLRCDMTITIFYYEGEQGQ